MENNNGHIPTLELYKNPFKYINSQPENMMGNIYYIETHGFTDDYYFTDFYPLCGIPKYKGENLLCLGQIKKYHSSPGFHSFHINQRYEIITAFYLPEDFSLILLCIGNNKYYGENEWKNLDYVIKNPFLDKLNYTFDTWENLIKKIELYSYHNILKNEIGLTKLLENSKSLPKFHYDKLEKETYEINMYGKIYKLSEVCRDLPKTHTYGLPEIYIDGKRYIRIEPFKPYFLHKLSNDHVLDIISYEPIDLYVEFMYNNRYIPKYIKDYNNGYDPINTLLSDIPLSGIDPNIPLCINNNIF